jgi:deoxyadenosine/deoxycytidine kinase
LNGFYLRISFKINHITRIINIKISTNLLYRMTSTFTKLDVIEALQQLASSNISGSDNLRRTPDAKRTSYAEFEDSISEAEESFRRELVGRMTVCVMGAEEDGPNRGGPFMISVEGNIGAGKSTLLEKMRQKYSAGQEEREAFFGKLASEKIVFIQEPVSLWESFRDKITGESILEKFYKDPSAYALAFQVMVYNTMLQGFRLAVKENPDCLVFICERSIDASRHIFAQMLCDEGMIDDVSFQVYMNMFDINATEFPLDAVLYLDVDPDTCLERVGKRSREGESGISLEYLQKCDKYYKKWLLVGK